jgi:hypothetical protein
MAKVVILIDHEIPIRHFVNSGVFRRLENEHEVVYIFPKNHKRITTDISTLNLKNYRLVTVSNERAYLWRRLYQAMALQRARYSEDKQFLFEFWREALGTRAFIETWFFSWPLTHKPYKKHILKKIGSNESLKKLLAEEKPDIVFHPTVLEGLFVSDLVQWAEENIPPVVFLMNSWDNPSTKAMTVGHPDWLVVWGEQSKQHAIRHLGSPKERILCFGAAQFDLYRQPPEESRSEFLRKLGLSSERKTLLYAGSSKGLNEVRHLQTLEYALHTEQLPCSQIIFRPHPWRGVVPEEPDFYSISWQFVKMDPQMEDYYKASRYEKSKIFLPDYQHTHTLLNAVDAVVSPVSTILLEAALHGKPVLAYMPKEEIEKNFFIRTMANMRFMREFFERTDCEVCYSGQEFIAACKRLLQSTDIPGISGRFRKQASYFVSDDGCSYSERVLELVNRLVAFPWSELGELEGGEVGHDTKR